MVTKKEHEKTAARVQKLMYDTKWNWARSQNSLRILSAIAVLLALVTPAAYLFDLIAGVVSSLVLITLFSILRVALRDIADLPDRYLDERQRTVRNAIYLKAYQYLAAFFGLVTVILFFVGVVTDTSNQQLSIQLGFEQIQAIAWIFLGPVMIAPNVALALSKGPH